MDQQERVVFSIVPILLLILLLRRARRTRFLLTYNYLDLGTKESAAVSLINRRRQRHRQRRARRQAWVYPRPQGWFEEMYNNRLLRALWKHLFRVTRETFDFICQLVEIHVRSNTRVACSRLLERSAKERARGQKRGGLGETRLPFHLLFHQLFLTPLC